MTDPSAFSVIAGFALFLAFVFALAAALLWTARRFQTPARTGGQRNAPVRAGTRVPYHCATYGHYFQRRYSDRWRCAQCGVLSDIVPTDLDALDQIAFDQAHREDFRRWEASS